MYERAVKNKKKKLNFSRFYTFFLIQFLSFFGVSIFFFLFFFTIDRFFPVDEKRNVVSLDTSIHRLDDKYFFTGGQGAKFIQGRTLAMVLEHVKWAIVWNINQHGIEKDGDE